MPAIGVAGVGCLLAVTYPITKYLTTNPRFVLGKSSDGKSELSIKIGSLGSGNLKPQKAIITINNQVLGDGDILCSPNQDGQYFLMKHISGLNYKLEKGNETLWTCRKPSTSVPIYYLKNLDGSRYYPDKIVAGTCTIVRQNQQTQDYKLTCRQFANMKVFGNREFSFIMSFEPH